MDKKDLRTHLGSNSKARSSFPRSLAATELGGVGVFFWCGLLFLFVGFVFFFSPVVLFSWHHTDSFLALILSRNSSVASVVLLVPKY